MKKGVKDKSMKADISTKGDMSSSKEKVFIDVSNSLSDDNNENSSFQNNSDNAPKHHQSNPTPHLETQYAKYKKKSIHEKSTLLNSKLTCVKISSDGIKHNVSMLADSVYSKVQNIKTQCD